MTERIVIKIDELDDSDRRNFSINTTNGYLLNHYSEVARFTGLDNVKIKATPEFQRLSKIGAEFVGRVIELSKNGVDYLEVTRQSITIGKQSAVRWRDLQPLIMKELPCLFLNEPRDIQVEDRTAINIEFGVLSEYIT